MKRFGLFLLILFYTCAFAQAAQDKLLKSIGDWRLLQGKMDSKTYCYATIYPAKSLLYSNNRNQPQILIAFHETGQYELGFRPGFHISTEEPFIVESNDRAHKLNIAYVDDAWTYSYVQDVELINDMLEDGKLMTVRSFDSAGRPALDYFSIKGINKVIKYFEEKCLNV